MVTHIASYTVNLTNIVSRDSLLKQNHFYAHCVNLKKLLSICLQNKVFFFFVNRTILFLQCMQCHL